MATVIIGAGIVGVSTAFYLAENDATTDIHLIETTNTLFASASGYAGGFLARDWHAPATASLAALSFDQHAALAAKYDGASRWSYAISTALSYSVPGTPEDDKRWQGRRGEDWLRQGTSRSTSAPVDATPLPPSEKTKTPAWLLRKQGDQVVVLADDGTTAQIEPAPFCQFLLDTCRARGVQLHQPARVTAVGRDAAGQLSSVTVTVEEHGGEQTVLLPCARLVITAGAWTPRVLAELFPDEFAADKIKLPVTNYAGHSLVVRTKDAAPSTEAADNCFALFAAGGSLQYCPEIFGRANGTLYLAGLNSSTMPLPERASDATPDSLLLEDLKATCRKVLGSDDYEVVRVGLCHRPATPWGAPLLLRLLDEQLCATSKEQTLTSGRGGVFVAAGHGPWGISMGPGTGMVLAELLQGRPLSADLSQLGLQITVCQ
ncbi:hypothetical protein SEPCBS57363_005284 [Sporothrix epigloea]|uniref:FAD dependent oxidoreductase domain-containing protein n=1 Tax=Sporothrix epigloea TaxID=1892477 RepID=A0ABP0DZL8_9PEZI